MAKLKEVGSKAKEVSKKLNSAAAAYLSQSAIEVADRELSRLLEMLKPLMPPSPAEKRDAKSHPLSAQITSLTSQDADRKKIFNLDFFKKKFKSLPDDRKIVAKTIPATLAALRNAVVLYYYRKGEANDFRDLESFKNELLAYYENHPDVKRKAQARRLFRDLMAMSDTSKIGEILETEFPEDKELKAFAKLIKVKIPAQKRGKNAPKKGVHERLAEAIQSGGTVARMKLR